MRGLALRVGVPALLLLAAGAVSAHEVRPGYLEIREAGVGRYDLTWKVPARGDRRLALHPRLPEICRDGGRTGRFDGGAWIERWQTACEGGIAGHEVAIDGLEATRTDVLVRVEWAEGTSTVARLTPDATGLTVSAAPGPVKVLWTYGVLGVEHILLGVDHLLFVLALLFLVPSGRSLVATVTAFTAAHSLTLSAATLGVARAPQAPVEAAIALSIVFVAAELARGGGDAPDLARRRPWLVAFAFGLLHGFGFAGALHEVGLPDHAIPLALAGFNVGVELGQLAFVGAVLAALAIAPRVVPPLRERIGDEPWAAASVLARPAAYAIGPIAAFWLLERTWSFWRA